MDLSLFEQTLLREVCFCSQNNYYRVVVVLQNELHRNVGG